MRRQRAVRWLATFGAVLAGGACGDGTGPIEADGHGADGPGPGIVDAATDGAPDAVGAPADAASPDAGAQDAGPGDAGCTAGLGWWVAYRAHGVDSTPVDLYVAAALGGTPGAVTQVSGPHDDFASGVESVGASMTPYAWSPDRTRLAYLARQDDRLVRELYLVDLRGPGPTTRKISGYFEPDRHGVVGVDSGLPFAWSPDGRKLAYIGDPADRRELFVVDVSGSEPGPPQQVNAPFTMSGAVSAGDRDPAFRWSPDSRQLLFMTRYVDHVNDELVVVDVSGPTPGPARRVSAPRTGEQRLDTRWTWSGDGAFVLYSDDAEVLLRRDLIAVPMGAGEPGAPVRIALSAGRPQAVPGSSRVLYQDPAGHLRLIDPSSPGTSPVAVSGDATIEITWYQWSPDGTRVALRGRLSTLPGAYLLFVADLAAVAPTLTRVDDVHLEMGTVSEAAWSPDGRKLLYLAEQNYYQVFELHVVDLGTWPPAPAQAVHPALAPTQDVLPGFRWAPDARAALFVADLDLDDVFEAYAVDLAGPAPGAPRKVNGPLTPEEAEVRGDVVAVAWAPDATHALYAADEVDDTRVEVFTVDLSASSPERLRVSAPLPAGGQVYPELSAAAAVCP